MKTLLARPAVVLVVLCLALPAAAQKVVDGDSIEVNGTTYRLYGIDAPDDGETCPDGWPAAYEAEAYLDRLMRNKTVTCVPIGLPKPEEASAICRADGVDLGAAMVTGGMAFAAIPYSARYISQEDDAAAAKRGVHRHKCLTPKDWRERLDAD